jgi:hypothetical protein
MMCSDLKPGVIASVALAVVLLAVALTVDFPKASGGGFKGDEATYYVLGHSLARDRDFAYERKDLVRVWEEYPGPEGIFLKRGKDIDIRGASGFPFVRWVKQPDPNGHTRLYFSKAYLYPLVAAPFVVLFGTNGFLVLHALLMSVNLLVIYVFINARTRSSRAALALAIVFLAASVVPVYFVWLTPELLNFSLVLYALFFWAYKEVAADRLAAKNSAFLLTARSDYAAAVLLGLATFSKPHHVPLILLLAGLAALRRQWTRAAAIAAISVCVTGSLFAVNAATTGEFNYQGGDRRTFYSNIGFPFANSWETFDTIAPVRGREGVMVGDVLVNRHSFTVFRHNIVYFFLGRNAGLIPYFFPGVLALALFLAGAGRRRWQWLVVLVIAGAILMHVVIWPFTFNGGGGPVGSRYFLSFYPLFLLLTPATGGMATALAGLAVGSMFTAQIVLNPFYSSWRPGEHAKSGALRRLPIELTLIHDLPMAHHANRFRRPLGGDPPMLAYFPDDNAYEVEADPPGSSTYWFWVKGRSEAEVVLRGAVANAGVDTWVSKKIARLNVEIRNSGVPNQVKVSTDRESHTLEMTPGELRRISLAVGDGVPFRRDVQPTSYLYRIAISAANGFVPFLDLPCERPGVCASSDSRYLGAMIHLAPEYTDGETTRWSEEGKR